MRSAFAAYLRGLLTERDLSARAFARLVGRSSGFLTEIMKGRQAPSDDSERWADALGLAGEERKRFLVMAGLARSPAVVGVYVRELEEKIRRLERAGGAAKAGRGKL